MSNVPKKSSTKPVPNGQFNNLTTNAFDFLEQAILEIDENPKRTIIEFYTAVELFLKARLMKEHWSLVVTKPENAIFSRFESGDFQSVTLKDARDRLKNIANDDIGNEAFLCFTEIGKHRNRLVHFHNDQHDLKSIVAGEVLKGVHYLDLLISNRWGGYFKDYRERMDGVREAALKLREFLKAKFEAVTEAIDREKSEGALFSDCNSCGYESAFIGALSDPFYFAKCRVCDAGQGCVKVSCPKCGDNVYTRDGEGECGNCPHLIEPKEVIEAFEPPEPHDKDSLSAYHEGMLRIGCCGECGWQFENTIHAIDSHDGEWMCLVCNEIYDQMDECSQCGVAFPFNDGYSFCSNCR